MDKLSLAKFIIANFNVREEEMLLIHAPTAALMVLAMMEDLGDEGEEEKTPKSWQFQRSLGAGYEHCDGLD